MKNTRASKAAKTKAQPDPTTLTQADPSTPQDGAQDYDPSKDRLALRELIARRGQPDDAHRVAYGELMSDADSAVLGGRTRAAGVFRDAVAWGVQIDQDLSAYPALVKSHYAETRFAYFLERASRLGDAVAAQQAQRGDQDTSRATAEERETAAREARKTLIAKLRGVAGGRDAEGKALSDAMGRTEGTDALGTSIQKLAALGTEWLARPGTSAKIHCDSAGLTAEVISAALTAAKALTGAASQATLAGRRPAADGPKVNLLEGTVLHEMAEAQRCFNEAHAATQVVRRLSPGAATRHVLGTKKASKPSSEDTHAAPAASSSGAAAT